MSEIQGAGKVVCEPLGNLFYDSVSMFCPPYPSGFPPVHLDFRTFLVAQTVKRLSTMRETWVLSLGQEDLLEKEMAIHSSAIAWKIPWTEEPDRLQSMGSQRVGHD